MKNADLPAMPLEFSGLGQYAPEAYMGLTKREHFAAMAMQGLLSNSAMINHTDSVKWAAKVSVIIASELLNELEKQS